MTEDNAHAILSPHYNRIALAIVKSFGTYRTRYPHRPIHRRTTAANVICDEVWAEIVSAFDDYAPMIRPIEHRYGLRLLGISGKTGEIDILLWFKKVDGNRNPSNYRTPTAARRLAGDTLEMFEQATLLVVGYRLNRDETRVISISITRPSVGRPEWYIELELPEGLENIVQIARGSETAAPGKRVVVRRIKQTRLGDE
jgi:hypothetical protein